MDYCYNPNYGSYSDNDGSNNSNLDESAQLFAPLVTTTSSTTQPDTNMRGCSAEVRPCEDGTIVFRDPENNCDFYPCQAPPPPPPPPTPRPTPSPTKDPSDYYCGYSLEHVNGNCLSARPCPSGRSSECPGMELCIPDTECNDVTPPPTPRPNPNTNSAQVELGPSILTDAPNTCDDLCVEALPSALCPVLLNLPDCMSVGLGSPCESDGECGLDDALNNCGTYDIYVRIECDDRTASQGEILRRTTAPTNRPTRMPTTPRPTERPVTERPTPAPVTGRPTGRPTTDRPVSERPTTPSPTTAAPITPAPVDSDPNNVQAGVAYDRGNRGDPRSSEGNIDSTASAFAPASMENTDNGNNVSYDRNSEAIETSSTSGNDTNAPGVPSGNQQEDQYKGWDLDTYFASQKNYRTSAATSSSAWKSSACILLFLATNFLLW